MAKQPTRIGIAILVGFCLAAWAAFPARAEAGIDEAAIREALSALEVLPRADAQPLEAWMDKYGVPGVSITVFANSNIVTVVYGVADVTTEAPVTADTLFQAASISKPVSAVGILSLVEDGVLDLDAPIADYLFSWAIPPHRFEDGDPITLSQILCHRAGFNVSGFPGYGLGELAPSAREVLFGASNTEPIAVVRRPNSRFQYSGGGYTVAQVAVEDATGQSFATVMKTRVLDPAGMTQSAFDQPLPETLFDRAATAYRDADEPIPGRWHTYPELAAAGLWTTPTDLCRFAMAVQAALKGEGTLLTQPMAERFVTPVANGQWGLGCHRYANYFDHGGSNEGYRCRFIAHTTQAYGLAVMTNGDNGVKLLEPITDAIIEAFQWEKRERYE